jgi:hypothetical protein
MFEKVKNKFAGDKEFNVEVAGSRVIEIEGISALTQYMLLFTVALLLVGVAYLITLFFDFLYASLGFEKMLTFILFIGLFHEVFSEP